MAVLSVRETFEGRDGQIVGSIDSLYVNRQWKITTDSATETKSQIYAQAGPNGTGGPGIAGKLPTLFQGHPENLFYTCRSLVLDPVQSKFLWIARARYSTAPISKEEKDRADFPNPVTRPTVVRRKGRIKQRYRDKDRNGNALLNSAEDKYPPWPIDDSLTVYSVEKNVSTLNPAWDTIENSLCSSSFSISDSRTIFNFEANAAYIAAIDHSQLKEENGYPFYTVSAEIVKGIDADFFKLSLVDEGFQYLSGSEKRRIQVKNNAGEDVDAAESQLLDGSGGILAVGGTPVFNNFDMIRVADWSSLPF